MWGRLAALPAMGTPPVKRQRNSKFDSRHRHRHARSANNGETDTPGFEREDVAGSETSFLGALFNFAGESRPGQVHGHLHRKQATVEVAVTLASTAVVSIGVDADGNPTATATTTLPAGTSTEATGQNSSTQSSSTSTASSSTPASSTTNLTSSSTTSDSTTPPTTSTTSDSASSSPDVTAAAATGSSTTTPSTTDSSSSSPTSQSAEPATTPSTNAAAATPSTLPSSDTSSLTSAPTTTPGSNSKSTTSDSVVAESSVFASLIATNGTTTSGLSLTTTSGADSLTAAAASSAVSLVSSESVGTNGTVAVAHTKSHSGSSSSTKTSHDSSSHLSSSVLRSSTLTSHRSSSNGVSSSATSTYVGIGGASATGSGAPSVTSGSGANSTRNNQNDDVAPPATIAGSVVGSVAGVALIVAILFFLFRRWHKQHSLAAERARSARELGVEDPFSDPPGSGAMTQHSGNALFSAAAMGGLFGRMSRHAQPAVPPEERGFQKVSGRKLPSAFSPGMEAIPSRAAAVTLGGPAYNAAKDQHLGPTGGSENPFHSPTNSDDSTHDWYRGDAGSFGGATAVPPDSSSTGMTHLAPGVPAAGFARDRYPSSAYSLDTSGVPHSPPDTGRPTETLLPSPARTPVIQKPSPFGRVSQVPGISQVHGFGHGGSPPSDTQPLSPNSPPRGGSLGRSHPSFDHSRESRFSEGIP